MCQNTIDHLRRVLAAILARDGKRAAYWDAPFTIRMSDNAGVLLYKILDMEKGGWVQVVDRYLLKDCKCTMVKGKAGAGLLYRRFYLCQAHAADIFEFPGRVKFATGKPAVKLKKLNPLPIEKQHKYSKKKHSTPDDTLIGWHEGVKVVSGGLPGLGKHR